ncbi:MAG TPA: NAD(P)/FAD-dependent oxidoreductase [Nitrososphaerales archaeon]|nr:NAD(P)/FAD-dependent oxidoreductase [Nitrososphaerales archaeon]
MKQIVICGGGIAGASAAVALSTLKNCSITLIEKDTLEQVGSVKRGEALRSETCRALDRFDMLDYFKNRPDAIMRAGEVRELFHKEAGRKLGDFRYDYLAPEYPVIHTSHKVIVNAAYSKLLKAMGNVEVRFGTDALGLSDFKDGRRNVLCKSRADGSEDRVDADLVIVAEGANSRLRDALHIPTVEYDYRVGYLMLYLDSKHPIKWGQFHLSREGFTGVFPTGGPLTRAAVEVRIEDLKWWLTSAVEEQEAKLAERAWSLEGCKIEETGIFYHVLKRHAQKYVGDGVCLIGDSAHTTHPMQAQGMSMALNDILHLYRLIEKLGDDGGREVFTKEVLSEYESRARPFNTNVLESNHTLFGYFEKLSQNVESFPECLPFMEKVGFKPVTR